MFDAVWRPLRPRRLLPANIAQPERSAAFLAEAADRTRPVAGGGRSRRGRSCESPGSRQRNQCPEKMSRPKQKRLNVAATDSARVSGVSGTRARRLFQRARAS
jgi:hypothetical protein